jgi:hypothetical protein
MGLLKKIFGSAANGTSAADGASQFHDGGKAADQAKAARDTRRELVQVVLRDTMRKHGVPSDWIDCRILSVRSRQRREGVHVQFLVRQGDEQLLQYVHAFQESFWDEVLKFEPQAREWLFSVAWQFCGKAVRGFAPMPGAGAWAPAPAGQAQATEEGEGDTQPSYEDAEDLASDLQALYAIRDAAISQRGPGRA